VPALTALLVLLLLWMMVGLGPQGLPAICLRLHFRHRQKAATCQPSQPSGRSNPGRKTRTGRSPAWGSRRSRPARRRHCPLERTRASDPIGPLRQRHWPHVCHLGDTHPRCPLHPHLSLQASPHTPLPLCLVAGHWTAPFPCFSCACSSCSWWYSLGGGKRLINRDRAGTRQGGACGVHTYTAHRVNSPA